MVSEFARKVIDMLSPSIGEFMARKKVSLACDMCDVSVQDIDEKKSEEFSKNMEIVCESLGPRISKSIKKNIEAIS